MADKVLKNGHISKLERFHLSLALTAKKFEAQASRESALDAMEDLGFTDELFQFAVRGSIKPIVKTPLDTQKAEAEKDVARIEAINLEMEKALIAADRELQTISVSEATIDVVLAGLDKFETSNAQQNVVLGRIGRRFRAMKAGTYAAPKELTISGSAPK